MANIREIERINRIESLILTFEKYKEIDEKELTYNVMFEYGVSKRTAREYIDTARSQCKQTMISQATIQKEMEALRKYTFREGFCFLCGCPVDESSTGVLHWECAVTYSDIKEEVVNKIYDEIKNVQSNQREKKKEVHKRKEENYNK